MPTPYRQSALCALKNPHIRLGGRWRRAQLFQTRILVSPRNNTDLGPLLVEVQKQFGCSCPRYSSKHVRLIFAHCEHLQSLTRTTHLARFVQCETRSLRGQQCRPRRSTQSRCVYSNRHNKHLLAFLLRKPAQLVKRLEPHDPDSICWFSLI
jgi:hypothetical protein